MDYCYVDYPSVIKQVGLNGFQKEENLQEPIDATKITELENKLKELQNQYDILLKQCQKKELIFTCEKKGMYYLKLKEQDKIYYEKGNS